jgi:histidinol-phosphatase
VSDLALALRLADAADAVTLPRFLAADLRVTRKPDRTPVTDADTAAEDVLRGLIAAERPGDAVLGEEGGGEVGSGVGGGRGWVLDPIDGTKNFSRGVPVWATLIALTVDDVPQVGVVSAPAMGRRWWAARGEGAWCADGVGTRRLAVSGVADLADAYTSTTDARGLGERWTRLGAEVWETRAFGDFWQYCLLAEGAIDVAVDPAANPWDLAAVVPIVEEAGGALTDLRGAPGFRGGDGLATNGMLHAAALAHLAP